MSIKLLAAGTNYTGTVNELPDCILDVENIADTFKPFAEVTTLTGADATRAGLMSAVHKFLSSLKKNDLGILWWSGHGTYETIKGKRVEAIVCDGFELIYDFELQTDLLVRQAGSLLMYGADSCYSGGLPRGLSLGATNHGKVRAMPVKSCITHKVIVPTRKAKRPNAGITGCNVKEVSYSTGDGGAMTNAFRAAFATSKQNTTLPALYKRIRKVLPSSEWPQTPQFHCDPVLAKRTLKSFVKA